MSYLVRAGDTRLLFDSGLSGGRARSALAHNADILGVDLGDLDAVVISHVHLDHVSGWLGDRYRILRVGDELRVSAAVAAAPAAPSPARGRRQRRRRKARNG